MSDPRPFLTAEWRDLVIANFRVPASLLTPLVPRGTILDLWQAQALVSLVGFRFVETRVLGVAVPLHRDFVEVNLRFYVRRELASGSRRAVVFIRELVPRRAIAWTARALYNEPYRALPMRHLHRADAAAPTWCYEWQDGGGWTGFSAEAAGAAEELTPGSKAEFITEHYWGYTAQRDGGTVEYRVEHPPWRVWSNAAFRVHGDLRRTYGESFGAILSGTPDSVFVAVGSPVTVFRPRRLAAADLRQGTG
ncbi:MAG: DUF2071 domain-containing protein [Phycisphaeraceae bacterium]|nr:DUF2071 domain-containing protein [Phycisphaeraceae bacterium]